MTDVCTHIRLDETGWDVPLVPVMGDDVMPAPEDDEVVVRVAACGVCFRDLIDREGRIPFINTPIVPGHEVAGTVIAVGPEVSDFAIGDHVGSMHRNACGDCDECEAGNTSLCPNAMFVLGLIADGGYARYLKMPQSGLFPVPAEVSLEEAASMHCTFGTAWRSMVTVGGLAKGERVIITGANGGVGAAAVQIAARFADEVVAVVRDAKHEAWLRELGATRVVVHGEGDQSFHRQPGMSGFDLVLENVGQPTFNAGLRCLRTGGRVAVVGNIVPDRASVNLGFLVVHAIKVMGAGGATRSDMRAVFEAHQSKPFSVQIDRRMPLRLADEAQRAVRDGGLRGRILLIPGGRA